MGLPHKTQVVMVKVDVDCGIASMVRALQKITGVRTLSSCQGTIGEGGAHPYSPQVMCSWTAAAFKILRAKYDITLPAGSNGDWGYVHPATVIR